MAAPRTSASRKAPPRMRALSLGELLDRAFRVYRERFGAILISVAAAMSIPVVMVANKIPRLVEVVSALQRNPRDHAALLAVGDFMSGLLGVWVIVLVGFVITRTAVTWIAHKSLLGDDADAFEGLERGVKFLPVMVGLMFVEGLIYLAATFVMYLPGILLVFGHIRPGNSSDALRLIFWVLAFYGVMVVITTGLFVTPSILLAETGAKVLGTITRSFALTKGRRGTILGGIIVVVLTSSLLYVALLFGIGAVVGQGPDQGARVMPLFVILDIIVNLLAISYYFVFQMVIYYDLRIRKEGLDLDLAAEASAG